ncbi:MAG TPA: protein kinase [Candidatus Eisenbacteria bacterium]|jgi:TolB-like protein/Tfp pilus assembly protein PilF
MTPPQPPTATISHYRLLEPLGKGAMGEVWLGEDTQLPRQVAVKLLPQRLTQDAEAVDRLLREAQAAASVDHPAVVTVYEAGLDQGRPYLVMQRVEGESLEVRLTRGPLPIGDAIDLAALIADALAEVHALGIVHRDLKPANVILTARGPKVLDFGVASLRGSPQLTADGIAVGTPYAMSPEQIKGLPPDNRSDLWALGVMLYQALTGKRPFEGASFEAVMHAVLNVQPAPPSALRAGIGPDLDFMVMKLLRKDAGFRYARAEDLHADLMNCDACQIEAAAAPGPERPPRLAVMPFEVMSAEADDAFLAAGLAEDLIVDLTRLGGLTVASRAEVMPYRDRAVPPRTLARELSADYLLLGSVRRAGNRARISTQLVRASDGHALWAERFDRTLEDLFDVQAEVSKRIVEALHLALKPGEREMLDRAPTRSQEAYGLYLRARDMIENRLRDGNFAGEELLKRAIEIDPDFALAHAALGECFARRALSWYAGLDAADQALPHIRRALELEPDLLEGHLALAMVHRLKGEPEKLLQAIDRVMALDPNHGEALEWAGWSYMALGQPERAREVLERVVERNPDRYNASSFLANAYEMLGRREDHVRMTRLCHERLLDVLRRHPDNVHARSLLAGCLLQLDEREAGIQQTERTLAMAPDDGRIRYNAACAFARAGLAERALAELEQAASQLPTYISDWPRRDPDLASLHDHPEFIRMFGKAEK